KWVESPPWLPSLIDSSALLEQLFGRIREIPAWGTLLRDGRLTQERTVAPRRLSTPNLPENQEIRSAPCARSHLGRLRWNGGSRRELSPHRACRPASSFVSPKRPTFPATPGAPPRPKHRPARLAQRRGMALPKTGPSETWMSTTRPHGRVHAVS